MDSSERSCLDLVGQLLGRDCCPDSLWGLRRCLRVCQERKTGLALGNFKLSVSVLYSAYRAPA